jgi:hypothetical protein
VTGFALLLSVAADFASAVLFLSSGAAGKATVSVNANDRPMKSPLTCIFSVRWLTQHAGGLRFRAFGIRSNQWAKDNKQQYDAYNCPKEIRVYEGLLAVELVRIRSIVAWRPSGFAIHVHIPIKGKRRERPQVRCEARAHRQRH